MHHVLRYLSTRVASLVCFILAVACKTWFLYLFMHFCSDRASLLLTTGNMLAGHGISLDQASVADLSQRLYVHYNGWPPGYNLLLAPFLCLLPHHSMIAYLLVDLVTTFVLFWYIRKLLLFIQVPVWLINIFLLFQALLINDLMLTWEPTDLPALAALIATVYYCLRITQSSRFSWLQAMAVALAALTAAGMRYQNVPVVLGLVACLVMVSVAKKLPYRNTALVAGVFTMAGMLGLWAFQTWYFESSFFLPEADKGFYPEHLQYTAYFITSSFVNVNFWATQLMLITHLPYRSWVLLASLVSVTGLVVLTAITLKLIWNKKIWGPSHIAAFFLYGSIASFITIALIVWLSLTNGFVYLQPSVKWTYVMNERYFAFPMLFVQAGICWWLFVHRTAIVSRVKKAGRIVMAVLLMMVFAHGIYYLVKNISRPIVTMESFMTENPSLQYLISFIQQQQRQAPEIPVVVASKRKVYTYAASLYHALPVYDPQVLNNQAPRASRPVVLLAVIHQEEVHLLAAFLKRPGVRLLQTVQNYHFYALYVTPAATTH